MTLTVNHSTAADGSFSATGATAWNAAHTLSGTIDVANGGTGATTLTGVLKGNGTSAFSAATAGTDYQEPITLTTTGTSGAATFVSNVLNIPQYSGGGGSGTVTSVALTAPSIFTVTGSPITTSGTLAISYSGTALPVANGGTGVTSSTGANSVMLRDASQNTKINNISFGTASTVTSATAVTLTVASAAVQNFTGTSNQILNLPDATTLNLGSIYYINNESNGTVSIKNNGGTTLYVVYTGGATQLTLLTNSTANGTWQQSAFLPNNVTWSLTTLTATSTVAQFSSLSLGTALSVGNGGTGATTLTGVLKGNGTSAFTAATAGTDYQAPITLTTTGTSGAATFVGNTLNIPQYTGGGSSGPVLESYQTISSNYSVTSGSNAFSVGPVSVATGVAVTVPTGQIWLIAA